MCCSATQGKAIILWIFNSSGFSTEATNIHALFYQEQIKDISLIVTYLKQQVCTFHQNYWFLIAAVVYFQKCIKIEMKISKLG